MEGEKFLWFFQYSLWSDDAGGNTLSIVGKDTEYVPVACLAYLTGTKTSMTLRNLFRFLWGGFFLLIPWKLPMRSLFGSSGAIHVGQRKAECDPENAMIGGGDFYREYPLLCIQGSKPRQANGSSGSPISGASSGLLLSSLERDDVSPQSLGLDGNLRKRSSAFVWRAVLQDSIFHFL